MTDEQKMHAMRLVSEVADQLANGLITEQEAWDKVTDVVVQVHQNTETELS
jgi:hypothetical protein